MGVLRTRLDKQFSAKKYPDLKNPEVFRQMLEGRSIFERDYMQRTYLWQLSSGSHGSLCSKDEFYTTRNPACRNTVVGIFPKLSLEHFAPALSTLLRNVRNAGLDFFHNVSVGQRIELLLKISEMVKERFWIFVAAGMYETGQSLAEAIGETDEAVDFPLAAAMYLEELNEDLLLRSPSWSGDYNGKRYVPHGTFLNIEPFNFPIAIPMDMAVKALAMGNSIIMKASDKSSLCGYLVYETICEAFARSGISSRGVVNYCPGGAEVVDMLLASPDIAGVSFTGSSAALDEIKRKHSFKLRNKFRGKSPLVFASAETSGVNVTVVWHDTDIQRAAVECAKSFLGRSGQKCSSARVIMVHEKVAIEFSNALQAEVEKVRFGDVLQGADLGPVITEAAEMHIAEQIRHLFGTGIVHRLRSKDNVDGKRPEVVPTILYANRSILAHREKARALMNTEIFGPVTTMVVVSDLEQVANLCNLSEFALTGTSFTEDLEVALELADIIPAGNLYCNRKCTGALVESECFGGLSSRSSPIGIKGNRALALFASMQTTSGFYGKNWSYGKRQEFVGKMMEKGFVFSKT